MARIEFKPLTNGEPLQIVTIRHESNLTKSYLSTGNDYPGITVADLGEGTCEDPIVEISSVENAYADGDHEVNVNDDFDGTVDFPAKSMICHELIGSRPATRPHK